MSMTFRTGRLAAWLLIGLATTAARADFSISNNLTSASGGAESASGSTQLAAGFGSSTGGRLAGVTLLLGSSVAGTVEVDIYSDDGLNEPGSLLGRLTQVGTVAASPSAVTFTASSMTLAPSTNYWVVLKALTGTFDWSYTASTSGGGTGAGYQGTWGESDDSGSTWFTYQSYPTQMNVILAGSSAVPEPSALALLGTSMVGGLALRWPRAKLAATA